MSFKSISAILRGRWFIDKQWAEQHLPLVISMLQGKPVTLAGKDYSAYYDDDYVRPEGREDGEAYWVMAAYAKAGTVKVGRFSSFDSVPAGSVAIIPVNGPILKYGGDCGEPGSIHMTQWVKAADASPNISAIIGDFDTPGGMVDGTATLADAFKNCTKRTYGFINDGMMASAGTWIGTSLDEVYASRKTDMIGSIGVLCTIADWSGYLEQAGIKLHEIYAPQSTEKNLDYKKALEGDYSIVEADLKVICSEFIKTVKSNRKGKLNLEAGDPFKGGMYFADTATDIGLIDGVKSFDELLSYISSNTSGSTAEKSSSKHFIPTNMFGKQSFKNIAALKGLTAEQITADIIAAANKDLTDFGIKGFAIDEAAEDEESISKLRADLDAATKKAEAAEGKVGTLTTELDTANKEVTRLKGIPPGGGSGTSVGKKKDEDALADQDKQSLENNPITQFANEHM